MKSNISRQFPNIVQRFFVGGVPDHASRGLRDCYKKSGPQIQQSPPRQLGPALQGHFVGVHWKSILRSTTPVTFWTEPAGLKITKSSLHSDTVHAPDHHADPMTYKLGPIGSCWFFASNLGWRPIRFGTWPSFAENFLLVHEGDGLARGVHGNSRKLGAM